MSKIKLGSKAKAEPFVLKNSGTSHERTGTIVYINDRFRWATIQFKHYRESFFFDEINVLHKPGG